MSDNTNKGFPSVAQQSRIPCPGDDGEEQPPLPLPLPPAQELTVCQLKEEKKRKNREYQQKSRAKKGWQEIEKRANDGILFEAIQIEFITNEPKEGKVTDRLIWKKGVQTTQVTNLKKFGPLKNDMTNGVIVQTDGEDNNRVAIPQGHIKEIKMVMFKLPGQTEGCMAEQHVGGKKADNGIVYSLIKWGNEYMWVAKDCIYEVESRRQSKRTKRLGHEDNETSKITGSNQGPPDMANDSKNVLDKMFKEARDGIMNNRDCDGRIDLMAIRLSNKLCPGPTAKKKKRDINLLLQSNLLQETLMGRINGTLPAISCLVAGAEDPSNPLGPGEYLAELVALAPTRGRRITELGKRVTFDEVIEGKINQPIKDNKEQKKKTPECSHEGCTTKAHGSTNFLYCQRHNPSPRMCVDCNDNQARRKGGLCNKCFDKTPQDDNLLICQGCVLLGKKKKPRNVGGFCTSCIQGYNGKKRTCQSQNCNRPQFKKQVCYKCFHKKE